MQQQGRHCQKNGFLPVPQWARQRLGIVRTTKGKGLFLAWSKLQTIPFTGERWEIPRLVLLKRVAREKYDAVT